MIPLLLLIAVLAVVLQSPGAVAVVPASGVQVLLKLIDQAPAIITALAALAASLVSLLNFRRLGQVRDQTNGQLSSLLAKNEEMHTMQATLVASLANSVPAASRQAADRGAAAAVLVPDRRVDAPPIKVDVVSTPGSKDNKRS
jgi:hypothetical protein